MLYQTVGRTEQKQIYTEEDLISWGNPLYSFCLPQNCSYSDGQLTSHLNYSLIQGEYFKDKPLAVTLVMIH